MTRTSLVVPSRGGAARLPRLLDSVARQSDQDLEVVVVVDGDVDGTEALLAARTDVPLRVVVLPENRGRSHALNTGFAAASGEVLVRCDDDLDLPATYVEERVRLHREREQGVVGLCRNVFPPTGFARVYGAPVDVAAREAAYAAAPADRWRHWGASVSTTRAVHDRVGPYDEEYDRYGWEDADWGFRLHALGVPITVHRSLEAGHHLAATTTDVRARRAYLSGRSAVRFEAKHGVRLLPDGPGPGPWGRAVDLLSRRLDETRVLQYGRRVESSLDWLAAPVAKKTVALLVEASAQAGHRHATHEVRKGAVA